MCTVLIGVHVLCKYACGLKVCMCQCACGAYLLCEKCACGLKVCTGCVSVHVMHRGVRATRTDLELPVQGLGDLQVQNFALEAVVHLLSVVHLVALAELVHVLPLCGPLLEDLAPQVNHVIGIVPLPLLAVGRPQTEGSVQTHLLCAGIKQINMFYLLLSSVLRLAPLNG